MDIGVGSLQLNVSFKQGEGHEGYAAVPCGGLKAAVSLLGGQGSATKPYRCRLVLDNAGQGTWCGIVQVALSLVGDNPRFFMPAFMYGRNRGDARMLHNSGLYPRLSDTKTGAPYSAFWKVRGDRLSHPVSMVVAGGKLAGISASPYLVRDEQQNLAPWAPGIPGKLAQFNGFGCSMEKGGQVCFTLGYENAPYLYLIEKNISVDPADCRGDLVLPAGAKLEVPFEVYLFDTPDERAVGQVVRNVYAIYHQPPRHDNDVPTATADIARAIDCDSYMPELCNYSTQVFLKPDGTISHNPLASISWTGGVEVATPTLMAALRLGDEAMREHALACIDNIVGHSLNPKSGLPFDAFADGTWTTEGWWNGDLEQKGHTAYLVGQALYYILKAYQVEKQQKGVEHGGWLNFVLNCLERIESTRRQDGVYPYVWSAEDGTGLDYDGFCGCWCLAAKAYAAVLTGDTSGVDAMAESQQAYYTQYVRRMECYGTPHDTWKAVDSEGILAYIRAVRWLHVLTGDKTYLDRLMTALDYEFTYKFCYNVPVQVPPLSRVGWSACGGSVTSTCNPHIHPMSSGVLDEMLYAWDHTGDPYLAQRVDDTLYWGMQSYNRFDGELDFGKKGWMSERFCHSQGLVVEKYPSGAPSSMWFCFLPWGASNVLEGMCGRVWQEVMDGTLPVAP
nr:hypothetical protein [bacterium]